MRRKGVFLAIWLAISSAMACVPTPEALPTPTPSMAPSSTPTVEPSPTPSVTVRPQATTQILAMESEGSTDRWRVLGRVHNQTPKPAQIQVQVTLQDAQNQAIPALTTQPAALVVQAAESAYFQATFVSEAAPDHANAQIRAFESIELLLYELSLDIVQRWPREDGEYILWALHNPLSTAVQVQAISLLGVGTQGTPRILSTPDQKPATILAGQSLNLTSYVPHVEAVKGWQGYALGSPSKDLEQPQISFSQEPTMQWDPQGNPFLVGVLRNEAMQPIMLHGSFLVGNEGTPLAVAYLPQSIPIPANQTWAFAAADFVAQSSTWFTDLDRDEELEIQAALAPALTPGQIDNVYPVTLEAQITGYENTGSAILLKGSTHNPFQHALHAVAANASASTLDGRVVSADSTIWEDELAPGEQMEFVLVLRMPDSYPAHALELDLRAIGLRQALQPGQFTP